MTATVRACGALTLVAWAAAGAPADQTYHPLTGGALMQDWSNTGLITASDNWGGVPSIEGYRGDGLVAATNVDPQTVLAFAGPPANPVPVLDVNANNANPNVFVTGGVTEFDTLPNTVVALQGSSTADAPFLIFYLDSTGMQNIRVKYNLRDVDGAADNSVQQVALQFRVGNSGAFTNVPAGYVADASSGPGLATLVTAVDVFLPAAADNAGLLQVRVITTDAGGSDEWIGVDDLMISAEPIPSPGAAALFGLAGLTWLGRRRRAGSRRPAG